jgi:hypothetical protein
MIGHWLFNAPFTATSMIGFIALAGIIVRNSILLVDFIRHMRSGTSRCATSARGRRDPLQADPADRAGGDDRRGGDPDRSDLPGLAISLLFGLASSTLLTVLVIPAIYVAMRRTLPSWKLHGGGKPRKSRVVLNQTGRPHH